MHFDQHVAEAGHAAAIPGLPPDCDAPAALLHVGARSYAEVCSTPATTGSIPTSTWPPSAWSAGSPLRVASPLERRALDRPARELLLAQSLGLGLHT